MAEENLVLDAALTEAANGDPVHAIGALYCRECPHTAHGKLKNGDEWIWCRWFMRIVEPNGFCKWSTDGSWDWVLNKEG